MSESLKTIAGSLVFLALQFSAALSAGQDPSAPNTAAYAGSSTLPAQPSGGASRIEHQVRPANAVTPPQILSDYTRDVATPIQPASASAEPVSHTTGPQQPSQPAATPNHPLRPRSSGAEPALALPPRGAATKGTVTAAAPLLTTGLSLAAVLALFLGVAWVMRRGLPGAQTLLPSEVVESLGRAPLAGRQQMQLIRCGNKLLLVCVSTVGAETLTEITDPQEVDRLSGLCRQAHPQSTTKAFRQVLEQLGSKPTAPGFVGDSRLEAAQLAARRPGRRYGAEEDDDV